MPLSLFGGDIDYWRNSSLRYLGYANEVGEAFRHQAPAAVKPSYGLALCYVCCDAVDKYTEAQRRRFNCLEIEVAPLAVGG